MRFFCTMLLLSSTAVAEPVWPAFRGPTGQGATAETSLPLKWSESNNLTWKTQIPGKGWSSPVIWGDEIWMTTAIESDPAQNQPEARSPDARQSSSEQIAKLLSLRAVCVDRDSGELVKDIELFAVENPDSIHALNSYASPTPVIQEGRLYCHFGTFGTTCLDTETGRKVWERRLPLEHAVGPGSSPVIWRDLLVLVCDGMDAQYVTALRTDTGQPAWKTNRPPMTGNDGDFHKAFSTPLVVEWNGIDQLLIPAAQWFVSYAPDTGEMIWYIHHGEGFSNVAAPVFRDGIGYFITGFTKPELWAIPVSGRGERNTASVLWEQNRQVPKKSSPALIGDTLYMVSDNGVLSCVDIHSGDIRWTSRLGGNYSASPIFTKDRIYLCSHEGKTVVVRPNPEKIDVLAENELDGQLMASPVPSHGALFIRSDKHLYRIEEK